MSKITLRQCIYFRAVAQTGGLASAARAVGISQPAVAQAIRKLEDVSGLVLFRRLHARGMVLTAQGIEFLRHAEDLLASADRVERAIEGIADNRSGTIRLGCFQSIAPFCLARIVRGYRDLAPGVVLEVKEMLQDELIGALGRNELDLAIMYDLGLDPDLFGWRALTAAQPYLIVSCDHRLAQRPTVSLREIASEDYILFDAPRSREYFFSIFSHHGINPRIAFRSASIESVRCSVANGLGVSLLAMRPLSNQTYDGGEVVPVELEENLPPMPIVIAHNLDHAPGALTVPFVDHCARVFTGL
ncbi:LysR family transcriptional regulator [Hoeflea sp. YIM 152468]|uniref:LysR family transcriptional regulator n=1 Tax=Hoeflea sp. YIM 152468 TaxID=3031759 RepID=UPI0023DA9A22|nr:LysR family transcriptional regulator [Hoeflea sp. YIM 152468]MDF1607819.1 LysR family transcriptional regulator [Hoeflea sp. YIM 152468]